MSEHEPLRGIDGEVRFQVMGVEAQVRVRIEVMMKTVWIVSWCGEGVSGRDSR